MTPGNLQRIVALIIVTATVASAQWLSGLGGAANPVTAVGYEAVLLNPALLGIDSEPAASIQYLHADVDFSSNLVTLGDVGRYMLHRAYVEEPAKKELLGRLSGGPVRADYSLRLGLCNAQFRSLGAVLRYENRIAAELPYDLVDLVLNGNQVGRSYLLDGVRLDTFSFSRIGFGYGRQVLDSGFWRLRVGATACWIHGFRYAAAESVTGWLLTTREAIFGELNQVRVLAKSGDGFSLTPGALLELGKIGRVGIVIQDAVAPVWWRVGAGRQRSTVLLDSFTAGRLIGGEPFNSLVVRTKRFEPTGGFWTDLPAKAALGGGVTLSWLRAAATAELPFRNPAFFSTAPRFSGSVEVRPIPVVACGIEAGWRRTDGWSGRLSLGGSYSSVAGSITFGLAGAKAVPLSSLVAGLSLGYNF